MEYYQYYPEDRRARKGVRVILRTGTEVIPDVWSRKVFTGTVGSIRYYAERLAAKGLSIEAPRLAGHGTNGPHSFHFSNTL